MPVFFRLRVFLGLVACALVILMPSYGRRSDFVNQNETTPSLDPMDWLASQFVANGDKVGCHPGTCTVLVTNFVSDDGKSSNVGHYLADKLATRLSQGSSSFAVIDRSSYQAFLVSEVLSPQTQNDVSAVRWIAKKMKANAAIIGNASNVGENEIELTLQFMNASPDKKHGLQIRQKFTVDLSQPNLPISSARVVSTPPTAPTDQVTYMAGHSGVGMPSCSFMPNPPITADAKNARFSGMVLVEALIGVDGKVRPQRIVRGAPYGLNKVSLDTLKTWRCKPALRDGVPVPTLVPFEVNFRMF